MANMEFQAKRIKFTMKRSSRERIFEQLKDANERMRKLLDSSDQVTTARQRGHANRTSYIISRKINDFWQHAKRLHEALSSAWQCACHSHIANLGLEHRTFEKVEFDVLFHLDDAHQKLGWCGTKIKMVKNANALSIEVPQLLPSAGGNRVRFEVADLSKSSDAVDQAALIKDICSAFSSTCPDCIGVLEADEHRFMLYPGAQSSSMGQLSVISLEQLLRNANSLTRRKRYFLALTLASTYLQLRETPWLNAYLRKDSIVFLQDPAKPDSAQLDHPYIRREISKTTSTSATDALSTLGIRLLELCFGSPIEATRYRKQLPDGDDTLAPIFDYTAALQWSDSVAEEAGPEFAEAIQWCLHAKALKEDNRRTDLWQHVIVPLEACHKQVSQKPVTA
jgi:hypothetical protein